MLRPDRSQHLTARTVTNGRPGGLRVTRGVAQPDGGVGSDAGGGELAVALGGLFDVGKLGFQRMVETTGLQHLDQEDDQALLSLSERFVSPARRDEFVGQLTRLVEEFESDRDEGDSDAIALTVLVAAYPEVR